MPKLKEAIKPGAHKEFFKKGVKEKRFGSFFHASLASGLDKIALRRGEIKKGEIGSKSLSTQGFQHIDGNNLIHEHVSRTYGINDVGTIGWQDTHNAATGKPKETKREDWDTPKHGETCVVHGRYTDQHGNDVLMKHVADVLEEHKNERAYYVSFETYFHPSEQRIKEMFNDPRAHVATTGIVLPESEYNRIKPILDNHPHLVAEMMEGMHSGLQDLIVPKGGKAEGMGVINRNIELSKLVTGPAPQPEPEPEKKKGFFRKLFGG